MTTKNKIKRELQGVGFVIYGSLDNVNINNEGASPNSLSLIYDRLSFSGDINVSINNVPEGLTLEATLRNNTLGIDVSYDNPENGTYECVAVVSGGGTTVELPFTITVNIGG